MHLFAVISGFHSGMKQQYAITESGSHLQRTRNVEDKKVGVPD